jgi:G:T-mismatch repair DNA endonuclease (very short patch repair protein)
VEVTQASRHPAPPQVSAPCLPRFVPLSYWHGHPDHFTFGKLGAYWDDKVRRTQQRDRDQHQALTELGYEVLRFWDFDIKASPAMCAARVAEALAAKGRPAGPVASGSITRRRSSP